MRAARAEAAVRFLGDGGRPGSVRENPFLRYLLAALCAAAAFACTMPWTRVKFERLHGVAGSDGAGPAGWRTDAGFTCLMTTLLTCVLLAIETPSPAGRTATRQSVFLLLLVASSVLLVQSGRDAPDVLGVTGEFTPWRVLALTSTFAAAIGAALRLLELRGARQA
jgi:hypothetical protein